MCPSVCRNILDKKTSEELGGEGGGRGDWDREYM